VNGVTVLSFRIQNTTGSAITAIAVTSKLPAGLVIALPNALSNSCGGTASAPAWMNSISLTGVRLAPGGSCAISVHVTATAPGQKQVSAALSYSGGSPITSSTANITVLPAGPRPTNPPKPPVSPAPPQPTHTKVVAS
jgi:hypothetical protein